MLIVKGYWVRYTPPKINDMRVFRFSGKPTTIKQWNCEFFWSLWWWFWHNESSSLTETRPVIVMEDNVSHLSPHLVTDETSCHPVLVIWIMPFLWNIEVILINISECTITKSKHNSVGVFYTTTLTVYHSKWNAALWWVIKCYRPNHLANMPIHVNVM